MSLSPSRWLPYGYTLLLDLVFPRRCVVCDAAAGPDAQGLCWNCRSEFELVSDPYCARCGDPVDGIVEQEFECSWCRTGTVWFDRARSAARYRDGLRLAVRAFKYDRDMSVAKDLVSLMEACVRVHYDGVKFDAVTAVPLHPAKERSRTFNQSHVLARQLARRLPEIPCVRALRRSRPTSTQTNLTAHQRRENVRGAFQVRDADWVRGRRFLLVDDVMTTGATVSECCHVLKQAGAVGVFVVTVARG